MSNTKKTKRSIIIVSVILILILVAVVSVLLVTSHNKITNEKMQQEIELAWTEANSYDDNSFMSKFDKKSSFVVTNIEKREDDCYTITCTVSSPDILDDLIKYQGQLTSKPTEKEMNQAIEEIISKASVKQSQHTVTAYKTDEGFSFEFNSEFINAMYGYSYDYCKSQIDGLMKDLTK